jgi:hypothetical protein
MPWLIPLTTRLAAPEQSWEANLVHQNGQGFYVFFEDLPHKLSDNHRLMALL